MKPPHVAVLLFAVTLGGCANGPDSRSDRPMVEPAARIVGEPRNCLRRNEISETEIRSDWTIDFIGHGGRVWRNELPNRCSGLAIADAFTYTTSLSEICDLEIIYPLQQAGGLHRGPGCGLGKFVPVELAER